MQSTNIRERFTLTAVLLASPLLGACVFAPPVGPAKIARATNIASHNGVAESLFLVGSVEEKTRKISLIPPIEVHSTYSPPADVGPYTLVGRSTGGDALFRCYFDFDHGDAPDHFFTELALSDEGERRLAEFTISGPSITTTTIHGRGEKSQATAFAIASSPTRIHILWPVALFPLFEVAEKPGGDSIGGSVESSWAAEVVVNSGAKTIYLNMSDGVKSFNDIRIKVRPVGSLIPKYAKAWTTLPR